MSTLTNMLQQTPYLSYSYAYPHKTSYRPLNPPIPLSTLWRNEPTTALFLYLHIPFCAMRCGFCNLFTTANPSQELVSAYLMALERQARQVRAAIGPVSIARLALGGGTPTYLSPANLERLFDLAEDLFGVEPQTIPIAVETSPGTADAERLRVLRTRGAERISIGVQSFQAAEVRAIGRSQYTTDVERALAAIRNAGFTTLNIDLMYGLPGQTLASWQATLQQALAYQPEELYLYPLYVRPLTGLEHMGQSWDDQRLLLYRAGRELLLAAGYTQMSMRMFRAAHAPASNGPTYCCQEDGMIGLGCGARSYTQGLHYASEYAVGAAGVRAILADYIGRSDPAFALADYGIVLDAAEQRRRYIIKSLLKVEGVSLTAYARRFTSHVFDDLPQLAELVAHGLATQTRSHVHLTAAGIERSDTIGPWLASAHVQTLIEEYTRR
ncbi:MAG: coproporphyrinogen III oxidase family protein [Chloroflexaceae bacterium]|nr:coproporphyrinogen III oxidase family protein [Chloroflexaceae bacterium]